MAYGAILGQMPQIDGIPAVIETYPIDTGYTITQGDVVDVVDGQIQKTLTPQPNVEVVVNSGVPTTSNTSVTVIDDNKSIFFYPGQYSCDVILYDYISMSQLDKKSIGLENTHISSDKLSNNYVIVGAINSAGSLLGYICSISGNTLSISSSSTIQNSSSGSVSYNKIITLTENSFLAIYDRSGLKAKVCTVSGTAITPLTEFSLSSNTSATYISATRLPDSGTTRRVCVFYRIESNNLGQFVICNISASNQITWGSPVTFESGVSSGISSTTDGNDAVFSYVAVGNSVKVNKVLGGTTLGTATTIGTKYGGDTTIQVVDSGYLVLWASSSGLTSTLLSNSLSSITSYQFDSPGNQYPYLSSALISPSSVLAAYSDQNNSSYGTATTLTVSGNQIAGSFLAGSKDAIALQGGTAGQSIEVIYSGTVYADWVTSGQTIASDGVYGVGVLDGVLQVWSKDRPEQTVTGSYVGTGVYGSSNVNSISTFGKILFAIIYPADKGQNYSGGLLIIPKNTDTTVLTAYYNTGKTNSNPTTLGDSIITVVDGPENELSWYSTNSSLAQNNEKNMTYKYIVFCY